uniref:Ovomucoid n=1 Tax=Zosterops lateralis melanops TaxID=1220523 RepID=A0A8D2NTL4_ZOSLA
MRFSFPGLFLLLINHQFFEPSPNVISFSLQLDCDRILHGVKGGRIFCSESSQPICGTDGKTYKNECDLCSACVLGALLLSKHRSKCRRLI